MRALSLHLGAPARPGAPTWRLQMSLRLGVCLGVGHGRFLALRPLDQQATGAPAPDPRGVRRRGARGEPHVEVEVGHQLLGHQAHEVGVARQPGLQPGERLDGDGGGADRDTVESVHGIGPAIADSVVAWAADPVVRQLLARLKAHGLRLDEPAQARTSEAFAGKTVVITGTLPTLSRADAKQRVLAAGGKVTDSVSKATSVVVVGADAGNKLDKARALGVETIDEAELLRRLQA